VECTNDGEDHTVAHATEHVYVASPGLGQGAIAVKPAIPQHQRVRRDFPQQGTGQGDSLPSRLRASFFPRLTKASTMTCVPVSERTVT